MAVFLNVQLNNSVVVVCHSQACMCLLWHHRRKNIKSLRFDNPVYRAKNEEEQFTLNMARHHAASVDASLPPAVSITMYYLPVAVDVVVTIN